MGLSTAEWVCRHLVWVFRLCSGPVVILCGSVASGAGLKLSCVGLSTEEWVCSHFVWVYWLWIGSVVILYGVGL